MGTWSGHGPRPYRHHRLIGRRNGPCQRLPLRRPVAVFRRACARSESTRAETPTPSCVRLSAEACGRSGPKVPELTTSQAPLDGFDALAAAVADVDPPSGSEIRWLPRRRGGATLAAMKIVARRCPACGNDAQPVTAKGVGQLDQPGLTLRLPYQCRRGHRFITRTETRDFEPSPGTAAPIGDI